MNDLTKACDRNYEAVWKAKNDKRKKAIDKAERQARLIMALLMVNLAMLAIAAKQVSTPDSYMIEYPIERAKAWIR